MQQRIEQIQVTQHTATHKIKIMLRDQVDF
jgi:hypothetical protein